MSQVTKKSKIVVTAESKINKYNCRHHQGELTNTIFFLAPFFKGKMKLEIIFIE